MQASHLVLDDEERTQIEKFKFQVSTMPNGHYVLIDGELPKRKNKFEGGNLKALICRALDVRNEIEDLEKPKEKTNVVQHPGNKPKKPMSGKLFEIKKMVWEDSTLTPEVINEKLEVLGLKSSISVVSTVRTDFLSTIRLLKELGALKE